MRLVLWLLVLGCLKASAQHRYDDELQLTETRFALESQIHGLKWGFLHNMDTAALGFNSQGFTNLYHAWKDRPDQSSIVLQWKPTALWWSEDGLFGLTTGPYFTKGPKDTTAMATGYFFTIWQRGSTSEPYRFVVDAGVPMMPGVAPAAFVSTPVFKGAIAAVKTSKNVPSSVQLVSTAQGEAFYHKAASASLYQAVNSYAGEKSFLLVSDFGKLSPNELGQVTALNRKITLQPNDYWSLSSGCYYEWGQLHTSDNASTALTGYYVHVWQVQKQRRQLLAAVYKFDQHIKP